MKKNPAHPVHPVKTPHTTGPWRTAIYEGEADRLVVADTGELIADCSAPCWHDYGIPEDYQANARLIAAAPDLLWIAERFLQIRRCSGNGDKGSVRKWTKAEAEHSFVDLENHARAAIARAQGKS